MDVTSMEATGSIASIVELQVPEQLLIRVIQINVTKDKTELSQCMSY